MIHKDDIPITTFKHHASEVFGERFPQKLISTLSNMLAIDFSLHKNDKPNLSADDRALYCMENIKSYLGSANQAFDDSFESATILFSVAISPPQNINYIDSVNQLQNKDKAINAYIEAHIAGLSGEEIESMRDALYLLLESGDANSVLSFITNEPQLFADIAGKHTSQLRKVRAQLIANEVMAAHAAKNLNAAKASPASNNLTIQSLIQDLAKHTSSEEYHKPKIAIAPKDIVTIRGLR